MAESSPIDVGYVAKLARLNLTEAETHLFEKQLGGILKYAEKLRRVNVSQIEAAAHASPVFNVFREDQPRDWFTTEQALSNAPRNMPVRSQTRGGELGPKNLFIVPKVVE